MINVTPLLNGKIMKKCNDMLIKFAFPKRNLSAKSSLKRGNNTHRI